MKQITINDIRALEPCYDPTRYLPENWAGTVIDILRVEACPAADRVWVVCREGLIDARTLRLFAVWCAREALKRAGDPDPRSISACDVAERYANGDATNQELRAAWTAAWTAARAAAWTAARAAAWAAARAAAGAAGDVAWAAAWDAGDAAWAAGDVAGAAAQDAQIEHLVWMLEVAQM